MRHADSRTAANNPPPPTGVLDAALAVWEATGQHHWMRVSGQSMLPLLRDGDHVLVAHGCATMSRGDVCVFRRTGRLVTHRVVRIVGDGSRRRFVTRGDNTARNDPLVSSEEMVGRVLAVRRGRRMVWLDRPAWRVVGWLIATTMLLWSSRSTRVHACRALLPVAWSASLAALVRTGALALGALCLKVVNVFLWRSVA